MKFAIPAIAAVLVLTGPATAADRNEPRAIKAFELYRDIVQMRSAAGHGKVPAVAARIAADLKAAGFADADIRIVPMGETAYMIVRYAGRQTGRPILFLGHMDVVDARAEDWSFDPFVLREEGGDFLGRGSLDNKMGLTHITRAFADLKASGFVPERDLYIGFSGDEETGMETTRALVAALKPLDPEYALNGDAGGGALGPDGKPLDFGIQVAEKTYATFDVTIRNPGGHSSRPRADNAIYELAALLKGVETLKFPVMSNWVTLESLRAWAAVDSKHADVLTRFVASPDDPAAQAALDATGQFGGEIRSTCVPTLLAAGHAENALPQRAIATINCRIFPEVPVEDVKAALIAAGGNPNAEWTVRGNPTASPVSTPRDDIKNAVTKALGVAYPGARTTYYQESGGTDGLWFRAGGIPTYGVSPIAMDMTKMRAHGLDENAPVAAFYMGLDYWPNLIRDLAGKQP